MLNESPRRRVIKSASALLVPLLVRTSLGVVALADTIHDALPFKRKRADRPFWPR